MTSTDDPAGAPAEAGGPERLRHHLAAIEATGPDDDAVLLAGLMAEPDRIMAESALTSLVDRRAAALGSAESFAGWAAPVVDLVGADSFVARRVQEWSLFKAVTSGARVDGPALAAASNWLQRKVTEEAESAAVLAVMGQVGRTKRVRNLAKTRAGRLQSPGR